jgi:hypothetical protein
MRSASAILVSVACAAGLLGCTAGGDRDVAAGASAEPESSAPPSCEESFAQQLVDVEINVNYRPPNSPRELAAAVDVVFRGELTGEVRDQATPPALSPAANPAEFIPPAYTAYEVRVDEILSGSSPNNSSTVEVAVPYNPGLRDGRDFAEAARSNIPVIVFAYHAPFGSDLLAVSLPDDIVTGCDDQAAPIRPAGEWAPLTSLDDVAAAVNN